MADRGNDIKPGYVLEYNDGLYLVVKTTHTQPGKGGAYVQAELKNLKTGTKYYERFRSDGYVKRAILEEIEYQYLFSENGILTLLDPQTCEQILVNEDVLGEKKIYLQDDMKLTVMMHEGNIISVKVPDYVTLLVVEADAVVKGQTVTSSYKPIILENGLRINAPQFIKTGDKVVVYTVDDTYYERESKG